MTHDKGHSFIQNKKSNTKYIVLDKLLSRWRDSNPRPADYKSAALAS